MKPLHTDFKKAFTSGQVFQTPEGPTPIRVERVGELVVPSGRIVACEPSGAVDRLGVYKPFRRRVPPGSYPVLLSLAVYGRFRRPACMMLQLSARKPLRWSLATRVGERLSDLKGREVFGFGVDAGLACLFDHAAVKSIAAVSDFDSYRDWYEKFCRKKLYKIIDCSKSFWGGLVLDAATGANLIACMSGDGDGYYASYWGLDASGRAVCLVVDFNLFTRSVEAEVTGA